MGSSSAAPAIRCRETDQASAALLRDLKARGLDSTLVIWGGEFGRTPMNEERSGSKFMGRDHHPHAFTMWLAGGGIRPDPHAGGFLHCEAGIDRTIAPGYPAGMKTAVSIPDDVFEDAERLAHRMKKSRSQLFSNALSEYVARHAPDRVTETMDELCAEIGAESDPFVSAASRRILERSEW